MEKQELSQWLEQAFSVAELGRFLGSACGEAITRDLPGADVAKARFVSEAVGALQRHGVLEDKTWWQALTNERPRRRARITELAERHDVHLTGPARDPIAPWAALPAGHKVISTWGRGRFLAVEQVGRGGSGTVYRTWDGELGIWRALKVLHLNLCLSGPRPRARFKQEASLMARLGHPSIVTVVEIGEELHAGFAQPWQVCEWVGGGNLDDRLRKGALSLTDAVDVLLPVLDALEAAHTQGVVHRDVKPANILLGSQGSKLCDFGLARLDEDPQSRTRMGMVGTQAFMAPEQRRARRRVDARADVYGAIATLVAAVAGEPDPEDLWDLEERAEVLAKLSKENRARLTPIVEGGCAKKPANRYPDIAHLRQALKAALGSPSRPVGPSPSTPKMPPSAPGTRRVLSLPGGVDLPLRYVPAGTFWMGSPEGVGDGDEHPRHQVTLTQGYWLGETPVTQAQWAAVAKGKLAKRKPHFKGPDRPMERVSWKDAVAWLEALGAQEAWQGVCLPTEAQWERACRAGTDTLWSCGNDEADLSRFAWFGESGTSATHPVGQNLPNPWGLHDMHGNVREWCWDDGYRPYKGPVTDPRYEGAGGERGVNRVWRGGSYWSTADWSRSACRDWFRAGFRFRDLGFRLLLPAPALPPTRGLAPDP